MPLRIVSVGTAVPVTQIDQQDALAIARSLACATAEQNTWLPGMYAGTNIETRQLALPPQLIRDVIDGTRESGSVFLPTEDPTDRGPSTAQRMEHYQRLVPPLAIEACQQAIAASDLRPDEFTQLVTVSCTGFFAPGVDRCLVEALGLRPTIERTLVGFMGCHGALNGLRVANALARDPRNRVLLCAVELCSMHYHYSYNPSKMIANAIFADGAAAVVGVSREAGASAMWEVVGTGSCYIPNSARAMTWMIGDNGFEMTLAKNVPGLIHEYLKPWVTSWLAEHELRLEDVGTWDVHPGGPRILDAVEEALGLERSQTAVSREIFARYGNMSSPTVLFILKELMHRQSPRPVVMLGFGPGLVAEAVLVR